MIAFRPVSIDDKSLFDRALLNNAIASCDYSFATIICWQHHFQSEIAEAYGCLLLRFIDNDGSPSYAPPLGCGNVKLAIDALMADAVERGDVFRLGAVTRTFARQIEEMYGTQLVVEYNRDQAEYIYLRDDLVSLAGTPLKTKRNHVHKFLSLYPNYRVELLNDTNAMEALSLYKEWRHQIKQRADDSAELQDEQISVEIALSNFDLLNLKGLSLWVDNKMIAFSFGEFLTNDTFLTHVEKALTAYEGSYAMINKLMAENVALPVKYINREEDMGLEYLRKSKMSYNPIFLLEKGIARLNRDL